MPLYDCGESDCDECQRAFGPDRSEAIAKIKTGAELDRLDVTCNRLAVPAGRSEAFGDGWRARQIGVTINPYAGSPSAQPPEHGEWNDGDQARGEVGFDYSHRVGTGTRIGPFQY